jgi:hypothetical protein
MNQHKFVAFRPFHEARDYVHKRELKSQSQWNKYCKSGEKPPDIPAAPARTYRRDWKGWGDWLGTGRIANQNKQYWQFEKSRNFVCSLKLKK